MVTNVKIVQKAAIIFENKILVVKRSKNDSFRANCWDFPGGNVDDRDVAEFENKVLIMSLIREIKEEVNIDIGEDQIKPIYVNPGGKRDNNTLFVWIGYKVTTEKHQEVKLSEEHSEYKWVDLKEFESLDFNDPPGVFLKVGKMAMS